MSELTTMGSNTSWSSTQAWSHLITNVLQSPETLNAFAYAVGCQDIDDFLYLGQSDFGTPFELPMKDEQGNTAYRTQVLARVLVNKLLRAQRWYEAQPVRDYDTWSNLAINVLNEFRIESPGMVPMTTGAIPSTPTTPNVVNSMNYGSKSQDSTVTNFMKSIKRSAEDYPIFNEAKHWYTWSRRVKTKAATHGCDKVLDSTYVPELESILLFEEQQKFMYDVFVDKVQTQRGKQIVRSCESNMDAQKAWTGLCEEYGSGVHAHIAAANIEAELMTMRCDSEWKSSVKFLNTWSLKMMDLEEIRGDVVIPDSQKKQWL
jgi:hypothetical protein